MAKYEIVGGRELNGTIKVSGSKNATLPILAASLLCDENVILHNVPKITDVLNMIKILNTIGVETKWIKGKLVINSKNASGHSITPNLAQKIRSSIFLLGSILSKFKVAELAYPGGCNIGNRPIDLHIKGLRDLGVQIDEKFGRIFCDANGLRSGVVALDFPSVGATENLILASVFSSGETTIINAAKEPEIVDLAKFLNAMGANVKGAGGTVVKICGVKKLKGCSYSIMPDRIVAGTLLTAVALTGGRVELSNCNSEHLISLISKLRQNCCHIIENSDKIYISSSGRLSSLQQVETAPYPGFPTDLQSQILILSTTSKGNTVITENLFETRFRIVPELIKMGAKISVKNKSAFVEGVAKLYGAEVYAEDLRGGASLVLAALVAEGKTTVYNVHHIDRGYYKFEKDLAKLGANIKRLD